MSISGLFLKKTGTYRFLVFRPYKKTGYFRSIRQKKWHPQGDSNPCCWDENPES